MPLVPAEERLGLRAPQPSRRSRWGRCIMWNLGKPQVFPAGSSSPREPERQMPRSDPSRLVWEAAAANERLGR